MCQNKNMLVERDLNTCIFIVLYENSVGTQQVMVLKRLSLQIKCQPVSVQKLVHACIQAAPDVY